MVHFMSRKDQLKMSEPRCGNIVDGNYCRMGTRYDEGGYDCPKCGKRYITSSSLLLWIESDKARSDTFYGMLLR
jgi:predicted RNA-binding Zn-ribbon protein involved in translation (DUF1610 family)